jgi:transposase
MEIEQLRQENATLRIENAAQREIIAQLTQRITELEKRLSKNSNNSSKPPSSDGLKKGKKKTKSLRGKSGKKSGGQQGHVGETLNAVTNPDAIIIHRVEFCCCGESLKDVESQGYTKRQVFDIPKPSIIVSEHQAAIIECPCCGQRNVASFPAGVNAPVQYGTLLQSYVVYLKEQQLLPEARVAQVMADLFNVGMSTATIARFSETVYENLRTVEKIILNHVMRAPVNHLDETGYRVNRKTQWLHVASNEKWTYYHTSSKRKALLDTLIGTVVHDHWKPYYQLNDVNHALCNAHHLRELNALIEDGESWAQEMKQVLLLMLKYKDRYHGKQQPLPPDIHTRLAALYDNSITRGMAFHEQLPEYAHKPARGRVKRRTGHNLLLRLSNYKEDVLRFITDIAVPFTNNQAEQDLRMMKVKQKISGCFRTEQGAKQFARIRSFISTVRKQGFNVFEMLAKAVAGEDIQFV